MPTNPHDNPGNGNSSSLLQKHEVAYTEWMPGEARNGCTQSPHYVPGAVLSTSHTDSFNPQHDPGGNFLHVPF